MGNFLEEAISSFTGNYGLRFDIIVKHTLTHPERQVKDTFLWNKEMSQSLFRELKGGIQPLSKNSSGFHATC